MSIGLMYVVDPTDLRQLYYADNTKYYSQVFDSHGKGLPFFAGTYTQRGHGLIGDLFRKFAVPFIKQVAPHAIRAVTGLVRDVRKGRPVKESAKKRALKAVENAVKGGGKRTTKKAKKRKVQKTRKRRSKPNRNKSSFPLF